MQEETRVRLLFRERVVLKKAILYFLDNKKLSDKDALAIIEAYKKINDKDN